MTPAGADAIRSVVGTGHLDTHFKSASHDLVTAADRASEQAIVSVMRTARPDDTIVGEEGGSYEGTSSVRWLVDPLDGTARFVYGRADFAVPSVRKRMVSRWPAPPCAPSTGYGW
jgi:myo-inositol-1(or 4)-monophosphatase